MLVCGFDPRNEVRLRIGQVEIPSVSRVRSFRNAALYGDMSMSCTRPPRSVSYARTRSRSRTYKVFPTTASPFGACSGAAFEGPMNLSATTLPCGSSLVMKPLLSRVAGAPLTFAMK